MNSSATIGTMVNVGTINVAYTGTKGTTAALPATTTCIRVVATSSCFIEISVAGTDATTTTCAYLPAEAPEYFNCIGGSKVSAIQSVSAGTIYVTPMN